MKMIMKITVIFALIVGSAIAQQPCTYPWCPQPNFPVLPKPETKLPAPPPVDEALLNQRDFIGANLNDGQIRIPTPENMEKVMSAAQRMHLKYIRVPITLGLVNTTLMDGTYLTEDMLVERIQLVMDSLQAHHLKAMLMFASYAEYDKVCFSSPRNTWGAFVNVKGTAERIIRTFRDHPALFAWDILNEAIFGAWAVNGCSVNSTIKSVYAMYELIESLDNKTPTTVGDLIEFQPFWDNIVSFPSPHSYPTQGLKDFSAATLLDVEADIRARLQLAKKLEGSRPIVIGEFGYMALSPSLKEWYGQAAVYKIYLKVMKEEGIGGMFWDLAVNDWSPGFSVLYSNGAWLPAAYEIVRSRY